MTNWGEQDFNGWRSDSIYENFQKKKTSLQIIILLVTLFNLIHESEAYVYWFRQPTFQTDPKKFCLYIGNSRFYKNEMYNNIVSRSDKYDHKDIILLADLTEIFPCSFDYIEIDEQNMMLNFKDKKLLCETIPRLLKPDSELVVADLHELHPFMLELNNFTTEQMKKYYPDLFNHHTLLSKNMKRIETFASGLYKYHRYKNNSTVKNESLKN